jgi:Domain of unknown function (DUF4159)
MNARRAILLIAASTAFALGLFAATTATARRWVQYESEMQNAAEDPPDAWVEGEFTFARLRYRSWRRGRWGTDANKSERLFLAGLRRLTRVDTRSVEEIVDIDSDGIYNWPFLYAVAAGDWQINEPQAARLREFFERGGTLMVDDFHGLPEWAGFTRALNRVLPGHTIVEIPNDDAIFHTVYNLEQRVQISGWNIVNGSPWERGGIEPHWRAALDSRGRIAVMICFNMDVGDAWEWSDHPSFPEHLASLAYRLGVNYVTYALTH